MTEGPRHLNYFSSSHAMDGESLFLCIKEAVNAGKHSTKKRSGQLSIPIFGHQLFRNMVEQLARW